MKKIRPKMLFVGTFNYGRQVEKKFAWSTSGMQAKVFMMRQLAKDHGVIYSAVANIFDGSKQNYEIKVDPTWKEKQNAL